MGCGWCPRLVRLWFGRDPEIPLGPVGSECLWPGGLRRSRHGCLRFLDGALGVVGPFTPAVSRLFVGPRTLEPWLTQRPMLGPFRKRDFGHQLGFDPVDGPIPWGLSLVK